MLSIQRIWRSAFSRRAKSGRGRSPVDVSSERQNGGSRRFPEVIPAQQVELGIGDVPFSGRVGVSVTLPAQTTPETGLLLMIHGMGSDWDEHDVLAGEWTDLYNMICLQVRDRHAGPRGLKIPIDLGKYQTIDCLRAVAWALQRWPCDRRRIVVWGGSAGGHMALMSMILAPELFTAGIVCCPFTHPTMPGEIVGDWQDGWIRRCIPQGPAPEDELVIRSPLVLAHRLTRPLVLMHGDADDVVSTVHSRRLAAALATHNAPVRYIEIPGANHDFFGGPTGLSSRKAATEKEADDLLKGSLPVEGRFPYRDRIIGDWLVETAKDGLPTLRSEGNRHR